MFLRAIAGLLLSLAFLHPVIESFDFWDPPIVTGNDTELTVVCVLLTFGVLVLLARIMFSLLRLALHCFGCLQVVVRLLRIDFDPFTLPAQSFPGSPPPLRI
jgi:hypothetical protein